MCVDCVWYTLININDNAIYIYGQCLNEVDFVTFSADCMATWGPDWTTSVLRPSRVEVPFVFCIEPPIGIVYVIALYIERELWATWYRHLCMDSNRQQKLLTLANDMVCCQKPFKISDVGGWSMWALHEATECLYVARLTHNKDVSAAGHEGYLLGHSCESPIHSRRFTTTLIVFLTDHQFFDSPIYCHSQFSMLFWYIYYHTIQIIVTYVITYPTMQK